MSGGRSGTDAEEHPDRGKHPHDRANVDQLQEGAVRARGDDVRGRRAVTAVVTAYPEAGVELPPTRVLSWERVTILEGRFVGPHPYGCPPDTTQAHFHCADGLTDRVRL